MFIKEIIKFGILKVTNNLIALRLRRSQGNGIKVTYAHDRFPSNIDALQIVRGGAVKYNYLNEAFLHSGVECSHIYAVSSSYFSGIQRLFERARELEIKVVWNQNGSYVPSAYGKASAEKGNLILSPLLHNADYVFYQSQFAKFESDYFLGERKGSSEVLYNAVDTKLFYPNKHSNFDELILLAAGSHNDPYRLPLALETLRQVSKKRKKVKMIIAGYISLKRKEELENLIKIKGLGDLVENIGPYTQSQAVNIFSRAHILLHTQYNDVCPTVVIEAMASGLPVVYSKTGGTQELVEDAGIGIVTGLDWETPRPPSAEKLAEGILTITETWNQYSEKARYRAVSKFDIKHWLKRHRDVFEMLLKERYEEDG